MSGVLNTIVEGDCIAGMNALEAGSVDLVFADPPFNIGFRYDVYDDVKEADHYLNWSREWMAAAHRALKPNGTFWLAIGDEYAAELKIEAQRLGFRCRSWVIWYYTFGVNCTAKFTRSHAHLFHFVKDMKDFVFRADELENRIPSARQLVYNDNRANPQGRLPDDTWIIRPQDAQGEITADEEIAFLPDQDRTWTLRPQDLQSTFREGDDTWYFPRVAGTFKERAGFHGCQMPEQLLGRIIRLCSEPGALVVDPFSGSGTTAAVARKLGRQYLSFDLSPQYVELGLKRLSQIRTGDPLDGSPEPLMSAPRTNQPRNVGGSRKSKKQAASPPTASPTLAIQPADIIGAFETAHEGFSADRVVVDSKLNRGFLDECRRREIPGYARDWNLLLFRLRKAGRLAHIPTLNRTSIPWDGCDAYLYASEIAWQMLIDRGRAGSIDEILCDPVLAEEFDSLARQFAPGFDSLSYRWAALKLRKQAKLACSRRSDLGLPRFGKAVRLQDFSPEDAAPSSGVYMLCDQSRERILYVGESVNLRDRLTRQFAPSLLETWAGAASGHLSGDLHLRTARSSPTLGMLAWQSYFVTKYRRPPLNLRELQAAS
jgi:site-specific DNA-methyltransferase (adenine-specific)